jgi:hypothetical protein
MEKKMIWFVDICLGAEDDMSKSRNTFEGAD